MKHSKITAEDAAKNPQAVLDVLKFITEQDNDESKYFEEEEELPLKEAQPQVWKPPLQDPKPKPSQSSPAPRLGKTPPSKTAVAKKNAYADGQENNRTDKVTNQVGVNIFFNLFCATQFNSGMVSGESQALISNSSYTAIAAEPQSTTVRVIGKYCKLSQLLKLVIFYSKLTILIF